MKLKNKQSLIDGEIKDELKSYQEKIAGQQKVINEILAKENVYEAKVKDIENINKNDIAKLKEEICRLINKTENVVNIVEDSTANKVVKELMGRNVTIVKTNAEKTTPKKVEENIVTKNNEIKDKHQT